MTLRTVLLISTAAMASMAMAAGTGPTLPENSREHPLDTREPRQEVIDGRSEGSSGQPRPPTLEAPPEVPPAEPLEAPSQSDTHNPDEGDRASGS